MGDQLSSLEEMVTEKYQIVEISSLKALSVHLERSLKNSQILILGETLNQELSYADVLAYLTEKKLPKAIPVFLVSEDNTPEKIHEAYNLGLTNVVLLPADHTRFNQQIEHALELDRLKETTVNKRRKSTTTSRSKDQYF